MSIATTNHAASRVVLHDVSWSTFIALSREASGGRLTYDRGALEIMSPSWNHEHVKRMIGRFIEIYTMENRIAIASSSSTTLSREDLKQAIEADESYYLASAPLLRGKKSIQLPKDPPPDLLIEVDFSHSSLKKLDICRALGIQEVWRYHKQQLEVHVLNEHGQYQQQLHSRVLPGFPWEHAITLLSQLDPSDETEVACQFRDFVVQQS